MNRLTRLTLAASACLAAAIVFNARPADARTWTQAESGRTIEAEFVKLDGDKLTLKLANGKTSEVPLGTLAEEDQKFARAAADKAAATAQRREDWEELGDIVQTTLWDVHLCCSKCEQAIVKAGTGAAEAAVDVERDSGSVLVRAKSGEDLQKAVDAIGNAGFYGEAGDGDQAKIADIEGGTAPADPAKLGGMTICCDKCVASIEKALSQVPGVKDYKIERSAGAVTVAGPVAPAKVIEQLRAVGLNARPVK